jgi:hypothetical protein
MTRNDVLLTCLPAAFTACVGYAAGRLHQWYRTVLERDEAYRHGYDTATRSVFSLAARLIGPKRAVRGTAAVTSPPGPLPAGSSSVAPPPAGLRPTVVASEASAPSSAAPSSSAAAGAGGDTAGGRHLVPDELVRAPTYRLAPDRVARAKVHQAVPKADRSDETTRPPSGPPPRAS